MYFTIVGDVSSIETIAARLASGEALCAELHWYECAGIGKREFKIKRLLKGYLT
jgi:hypothetical protein